jgi:hypothetical protein
MQDEPEAEIPHVGDLIISMEDRELSLEQIRSLVEASGVVARRPRPVPLF